MYCIWSEYIFHHSLQIRKIFYSISILFLFLDTFSQQMQVHQQRSDRNSLHVTGRESGTSFQEQISRLPTVPLFRQVPSWSSQHRLKRGPGLIIWQLSKQIRRTYAHRHCTLCVAPVLTTAEQSQAMAGSLRSTYRGH